MKRMILSAVMLLALIPIILIGYGVNHYAQITIKSEKLDSLANVVHMLDVHLSRYYEHVIHDVRQKAQNDILRQLLDADGHSVGITAEERSAVMEVLLEYAGFSVAGGAVINADGKTVLSSRPGETGLQVNKTDLFRAIMGGKESYQGMMTVNASTELIVIAVPIHDDQGRIIGILKQSAKQDLLNDYLGSLNLEESGHAFLIRRNGTMIFSKNTNNTAMLYHEYQKSNSLEQLVTDVKTGRLLEEKGVIEFTLNCCEYIGAYEKVESVGCIAVVAANKDEILGEMERFSVSLSAAVVFVMLLIITCAYYIGCRHVRALKKINDTLKKISNGDLTARCRYSGVFEYEELCRNINSLADSYQKSEKELRMSSRIDSHTHLPNRNAIYELLDTLLYKHPNQALMLIELDGFRSANENLGYEVGDRILMEVGDILRGLPQHVCYPSRLVGAEFLVFITNWTAPRYPEKIAEKIISQIEGIRFIDEIHVDIGAIIGIEYTGNEKTDKKKLIKHCSIAVNKARSTGRNSYFVYYPFMQ